VTIGWDNFTRVFTDEGIQKPFFAIFVWTVVFSVLTVILTVPWAWCWPVWCSGNR
jgi:maltose/maltodextrin transport system permease protein